MIVLPRLAKFDIPPFRLGSDSALPTNDCQVGLRAKKAELAAVEARVAELNSKLREMQASWGAFLLVWAAYTCRVACP
jgi:hypothetical protein